MTGVFNDLRRIALISVLMFSGCDRLGFDRSELGVNEDAAPEVEDEVTLGVDDYIAIFDAASLETEEEVRAAASNAARSRCAILFVHVDWSLMQLMQPDLAAFMIEQEHLDSEDPVMFHYVDCTSVTDGYAPLRSLPGWRELEEARGGGSLIHGWGELVWMKQGQVLHVESIRHFESTAELLDKTDELFL